jgi:RimJ/RimL family protein N-acetyltransferase
MQADLALSFRPVTAADYPLLRRWLNAPHISEWWGAPEEELGFIRDMVEGRDTTRPYLIELDGEPVGYIQCWFIGHHQNARWLADHPRLAELPSDAVGVDLSIGEASLLSRGIGSAALAAFVRMLLAEGHRTIIIDPDPENARAVRAYARAGFRPIPRLEGRTGDSLIMQYHADGPRPT